jgi:hypothetical protein
MLESFLSGAISMGFLVISLFFLRFWQKSRDRLFIFFSLAFVLLLIERIVRHSFDVGSEWAPAVYCFRLVGYGLILYAVIDKNRRA